MVSGTGPLTSFPVLIRLQEKWLKTLGNGGQVAQSDGGDILFTNANGTTKIDHEIEGFDGTKGDLVAWVKIPSLSLTTDTTIYIYYGSSDPANQWNTTGTWDEGGKKAFRGVWHLATAPKKSSSTPTKDATSFGNDGTDLYGSFDATNEVPGKIGKGFRGKNDENVSAGNSASLDITGDLTISYWAKFDSKSPPLEWSTPVRRHDTGNAIRTYLIYFHYNDSWGLSTTYANDHESYRDERIAYGHADDHWHHLVVVRDFASSGSGGTISFYRDGASVNTATIPANLSAAVSTPSTNTIFGCVTGIFDEIRISATTRGPAWINASYTNQNASKAFLTLDSEENL